MTPATHAPPAAPGTTDVRNFVLGYLPAGGAEPIWIGTGGTHRVAADRAQTAQLLFALLNMTPPPGARLVVLGTDVGKLRLDAQDALQARFAVLPAEGGLISHLNAYENIVLPLGFHHPQRVPKILPEVEALLTELGESPHNLLAKLPEEMSLYEKKLTGFVRILLDAPELMLAVDLAGGLEPGERGQIAGWAKVYHAVRANGTFIEFTDTADT
jgi:ABC-type transporter Mla maintaining outer membrane lipid asymmetry ATPase subunit MlaF